MSILGALDAHYARLEARGDTAPLGYSTENIAFYLVLSAEGEPKACLELGTGGGRKRTGRPLTVPEASKRSGIRPASFFLWDNSKFVLGLGLAKSGDGMAAYPTNFATFRDLHERLLDGTDDPGLLAVLGFVRGWTPDRFAPPLFIPDVLEQTIVFQLDGDLDRDGHPRFVHDRPAARAVWERHKADRSGVTGVCLVTGRTAPIARLHPAIKGVWGAQTSGASLVSFNLDAFTSYGKEQGENAPVSETVARNYGVALNRLLARDSRNRVQIADASTVFWADSTACGEDVASRAEALVHGVLEPPRPPDPGDPQGDAEETRKLRDALEQVARGEAAEEIDPEFDPATRFHILGLAPNAARLSVRFWHQTTLGPLVARLHEHWKDLEIDPPAWRGPPSARALLYPLALQEKADNIPPLLGGELMRAILTGDRYPRALLAAVIQRIRAGEPVTGARAAICKAVIRRDARKREGPGIDPSTYEAKGVPVSLDRSQTDPAYRLGRLFAVLENVQRAALGRVNASIRDRYFGAASATPASVFPLLLRNANHHLAVLRKDRKTGGLAVWFEREIGQIVDGLEMTLPRHLRLEDQGRFAVGYYHQRYTAKPAAGSDIEATLPEDLTVDQE